MAIRKCPRCELNYILDDMPYCTVCMREIKGERSRDAMLDLCSVCNENPALPGKDLCLFCLKEMEKTTEPDKEELSFGKITMEGASEMEEIAVDSQGDIPDPELGEIDREFSLEEAEEGSNESKDDDI